jgi:hypothetical protein
MEHSMSNTPHRSPELEDILAGARAQLSREREEAERLAAEARRRDELIEAFNDVQHYRLLPRQDCREWAQLITNLAAVLEDRGLLDALMGRLDYEGDDGVQRGARELVRRVFTFGKSGDVDSVVNTINGVRGKPDIKPLWDSFLILMARLWEMPRLWELDHSPFAPATSPFAFEVEMPQDEEAEQAESDTPTDATRADGGTHAGSIRVLGADWEIRYGGKRGLFPVKDFGGLEVVAKLLSRPNHPFQLDDLVDAETATLLKTQESCDDIHDDNYIANLGRRLNEVRCERARHPNDPLVQRECDEEEARITSELKQAVGPKGRRRKLGRTKRAKVWDTLTKKLRRLFPRLREAKMPLLADHLEGAIRFDQPFIAYYPPGGALPWNTEG